MFILFFVYLLLVVRKMLVFLHSLHSRQYNNPDSKGDVSFVLFLASFLFLFLASSL